MSKDLKPVDLVIVIDTSLSMEDEAEALSRALSTAVDEAKQSCPSDLRVQFLGIEGTFTNSEFNQTVRQYLTGKGVNESVLKGRIRDSVANAGAQEDVARAVEDISAHYDWRPGAERNLFVLGDESLEGGDMTLDQNKIQACDKAIASALRNGVKVHSYLGTPHQNTPYPTPADEAAMEKEYKRLALRTGGEHYIYTKGMPDFTAVLKQTICASRIPHDESVADKKGEADKLEGIAPSGSSSNICDHAGEIIKAVNTLAGVLDKLVDVCGKDGGKHNGCKCNERHETPSAPHKEAVVPKPEPTPVPEETPPPTQPEAKPEPQEDQVPPPPPQNDELYAIVLQDRTWWKGNKDDNGDLYSHDAKTGERKAKINDAHNYAGQSNAIAPDGTHYIVQHISDVWVGQAGQHFVKSNSLSGGRTSIDSFAFRQDGTGFFFHASNNQVSYFKHDPANPNPSRSSLRIVPAPGETQVPFGRNDNQFVADIAFDGNNRAWLIGLTGNLWVVDDTSSATEWQARFVKQFPQLELPGESKYIGIAFDSAGNVFLCGGQKENTTSCRRFIARGSVQANSKLELIYDGGPQSGSYGDLSSNHFPKIKLK
ncbi:MAG: hypothetical protein E7D37_10885 [Enterobacter cloacae]|nr:hypothetical protein [Enterobacter cloacae]MDU2520695.1 hypothetical protein [Enterobacter cloacae]MDU2668238.1 hypothetical protein [Enterobacter cloacae]